jgi:hypothetical protein
MIGRVAVQRVFAAFVSMSVSAVVWANVTLPNIGGGGEDIETHVGTKFSTGMRIVGLLIGCAIVFSIAMAIFNYTQKRWREGHGYMIGAAVGGTLGALMFAIAQFFAGN